MPEIETFNIPERDEDLLIRRPGFYHIRKGDDLQSCVENFREFETRHVDEGPDCMLEYFDYLFQLIKKPSSPNDEEVKDVNILLDLASALTSGMSDVFTYALDGLPFMIKMTVEKAEKNEIKVALKARNSLMMHLYLLWRVNSKIESLWIKWYAQQKIQASKNRLKSKGKKGVPNEEDNEEVDTIPVDVDMEDVELAGINRWPPLRLRMVEVLCHILCTETVDAESGTKIRNAVRFLWPSGIAEISFIKTISRIFLDWLETEEHRFKQSTWLLQACRLLVPLVIGFGQSDTLGALILEKTIHLDWIKDSFPFIEAIQRQTFDAKHPNFSGDVLGKKNALDGILVSMVVQTAAIRPQELLSATNHNTTRALVCFIQTVSARAPHVMIKYIAGMMRFLREDPYQLRGAVLTAMAELILSDEMTEQLCQLNPLIRDARKMFFDTLQRHLRDQTTQIRAKVVSLWKQLAEEKKIPRFVIDGGIIDYIGERLEDKQVLVRKPAIAFMSTFLRNNPYGHDFSFAANEQALLKILTERDLLFEENPEYQPQRVIERQFEDVKELIENQLVQQLDQAENDDFDGGSEDNPELMRGIFVMIVNAAKDGDTEELSTTISLLIHYIRNGKYIEQGLDSTMQQKELIAAIFAIAKERFLQCEMINSLGNDIRQLQGEEQRLDWIERVKKTNANIAYIKSKMHLELSLADTLQSALRGALQGDAAELKEAINFIIECKNFEISKADDVIRQAFSLIWRNSVEIQREVLSAAKRMLISQNSQKSIADEATAMRMIEVLRDTNEIEFLCISEVIKRLFLAEDGTELSDGVLQHLFKIMLSQSDKYKDIKLPALKLLSIFTNIYPSAIRGYLRPLQNLILKASKEDADEPTIEIGTAALSIIAGCGTEVGHETENDDAVRARQQTLRIPFNDSIFSCVEEYFITRFLAEECHNFGIVSRLTLDALFGLCGQSGRAVCGLAAKVVWYLRRATRVLAFYEAEANKAARKESDAGGRSEFLTNTLHLWRVYYDRLLERTLLFCGELAQQIFIYIDEIVVRELKRMQEIINCDGNTKKTNKTNIEKKRKGPRHRAESELNESACSGNSELPEMSARVLATWESDSAYFRGIFQALHPKIQSSKAADNASGQDESGAHDMAGAQLFNQLLPPHILGRLAPLINFCVRANSTSKSSRAASASSFAKMVPLAQQYAKRASFMLTLMMTASQDPLVRENLLISMVDIFEFVPIPFDNYQAELFNMCRDVNSCVRETALLVLLHVTSDGLVQNRSGVADIARCFVDPVEDIQIMARIFFAELSTKKNMIFNAMPDFLSRLTRNSSQISFEDFKKIMTPLLEYLEAMECEDMVLRVLQRLESTDSTSLLKNEQLPLYLVWVLNMVAKNEKSFAKIRERRKALEKYLHVDGVWELLGMTLERLKKLPTGNAHFVSDIDQLLEEMDEIHEKAKEVEKTMKKATAFQRRVKQTANNKTPKRMPLTGKKRVFLEDLDEDSEDPDE